MNIKNRTIYCKDNIDILSHIDSESIDCIYLDPPFNKNKSFTAPIGSTASGASFKDIFSEEDYKEEWKEEFKVAYKELFLLLESMQFFAKESDVAYIAYMAKRIIECHRILKDTGSIFYHCDDTMQHYIKIMLDTIFGRENFRNEINWRRTTKHSDGKKFGRITDAILYYQKSKEHKFIKLFQPRADALGYFKNIEEETGRKYVLNPIDGKGKQSTRIINGIKVTSSTGRQYWSQEKIDKAISENRIVLSSNNRPRVKLYMDEDPGIVLQDIWLDIPTTTMSKKEKRGYPTQKPLKLLERIINCSTNEGDIVLDPFCGCATACVAAEKLNRKWIGIDVSIKAYELVKERLQQEVEDFDINTKQYDVFGERKIIHFETEPPKLSRNDNRPSKWVYIISNPSHKGYKVGIAKDINQRLNGYQTSDPNRAFKVEFKIKTKDFMKIEKEVHIHFEADHEWVEADLNKIKKFIKSKVSG